MAIHGKKGKVTLGANLVADLDTWSMDVDRSDHETTSFGDSDLPWRDFIAGLVGATAKLDGRLNMSDTNGQFAMWQSLTSDTNLSGDFNVDDTHKFSCDFFITKFSPKVSVNDPETVGWEIRITGAVAYT
jgi:hypothetical protein